MSEGVCGDMVSYPTAVTVELPNLNASAKTAIWRLRQLQNQAYNLGVECVLREHQSGERIPNPRNNSAPLTQLRASMVDPPNLLLQRGGFWSGVISTKKWSDHRRKLWWSIGNAADQTDKALEVLTGLVVKAPASGDLMRCADDAAKHVNTYRACCAEQVRLLGLSPKQHSRTSPSDAATALTPDDLSVLLAATTSEAEEALERFVETVAALRQTVTAVPSGEDKDQTKRLKAKLRGAATKLSNWAKKESKARNNLAGHIQKGERKLFRSRHRLERQSGPALVFYEGCKIVDGALFVPGRVGIAMPDGLNTFADVAEQEGRELGWSGAVHIVDVTDKAGKVTRRTEPKHRKYQVRFLCKAIAPTPEEPQSPEQSLGTDWGVEIPLACSDGSTYGRYPNEKARESSRQRQTRSRELQQSMSNKTPGSNRHEAQRRCRKKLLEKNTNIRINHQLHIAKDVVTKPDVRRVVLEDTKVRNMTSSAVGTQAFPTKGSAGKRGLNKRISETAPARLMEFTERAGVVHSRGVVRVNPAYTSLTCFVCGAIGQRETQALFHCPECGVWSQADIHASFNTNERGSPGLYPSDQDSTYGGRDSRRKMLEEAVSVYLDSTADSYEENVTNKYARSTPVGHSGI